MQGGGESYSPELPFLKLDNFIGTPHASGPSAIAGRGPLRRAVANVARFLRGERLLNVVDRSEYRLGLASQADGGPDIIVAVELRVAAPLALPADQRGLLRPGRRPFSCTRSSVRRGSARTSREILAMPEGI